MNRKSWRNRFVARLVADVSRSAPQRTTDRARLFPYAITDTLADPFNTPVRLRLAGPPAAKDVEKPVRHQQAWHFVKR